MQCHFQHSAGTQVRVWKPPTLSSQQTTNAGGVRCRQLQIRSQAWYFRENLACGKRGTSRPGLACRLVVAATDLRSLAGPAAKVTGELPSTRTERAWKTSTNSWQAVLPLVHQDKRPGGTVSKAVFSSASFPPSCKSTYKWKLLESARSESLKTLPSQTPSPLPGAPLPTAKTNVSQPAAVTGTDSLVVSLELWGFLHVDSPAAGQTPQAAGWNGRTLTRVSFPAREDLPELIHSGSASQLMKLRNRSFGEAEDSPSLTTLANWRDKNLLRIIFLGLFLNYERGRMD